MVEGSHSSATVSVRHVAGFDDITSPIADCPQCGDLMGNSLPDSTRI